VPASMQTLPWQQGPSFLPQGLQSPLVLAPKLSQNSSKLAQPPNWVGRPSILQHGWSKLPQAHCPLLHRPRGDVELLSMQFVPSATQTLLKQQPPPLQV
jgi:hypothetical protein